MRSLELCAGCGGMSLGLKRAGFEPLLLVEQDAHCVATLRANGWRHVLHADLRGVDFRPYQGRVDLVAGGVPCQPFSVGGLDEGKDDARNLFEEAIRCVRECEPRGFLFENVSGLARERFAPYVESITRRLAALGYRVQLHLVDASRYGVAQRRRRCLLVGVRGGGDGGFEAPSPSAEATTVREMMRALGPPNGVNRHEVRAHAARSYANHLPSRLDAPSKTVLAGCNGPGGGNNCVMLDDGRVRYFTLRELARLQGFPDSYVLAPVWSHAVKQLGNAAPPPLVYEFAKKLAPLLTQAPARAPRHGRRRSS